MGNIPNYERATDPREQYIKDIQNLITKLKDEQFQVIMAGDMNININKDAKETRNWKEMMREAGLVNTMQTWWPNINHKIVIWGGEIMDRPHIYQSR